MPSRAPRFAPIPAIPQQGLTDWQFSTLNAMKENIELLNGTRGSISAAVTRGAVGVNAVPAQTMTQVTAVGAGFTISNVTVPSLDDYAKLVNNVQQLANDVATLRSYVNALIAQLKG